MLKKRNYRFNRIDLGEFKNDFFCNFKNVILELKYEPNLDSSVRKMIDNIKVRYAKNSKYINCALNYVESFS